MKKLILKLCWYFIDRWETRAFKGGFPDVYDNEVISTITTASTGTTQTMIISPSAKRDKDKTLEELTKY